MLERVWRKGNASCTVGGNVKWYSHYGRQYGDSLKKLGIKPLYDPAIPLLGIHPEETRVEKNTCTPLFIAALFTIAGTWKWPRCPSTDEWIKKLWYIYMMEYYSAIKRNTFESVLMRWMNLHSLLYRMKNLEKMVLKNVLTGHQWRNRHREQTYGHGQRGGEGEKE